MPWCIDYISTVREAENIDDTQVRSIDTEAILGAPERISKVVQYIREHFDQKTKRNSSYMFTGALQNIHQVASARDRHAIEEIKKRIRLSGFNSIFAVSSIEAAKKYYTEFKRQQSEAPEASRLKVAIIFSYGVNEDEDLLDGLEDENSDGTEGLDSGSRDFLDGAIKDYNSASGLLATAGFTSLMKKVEGAVFMNLDNFPFLFMSTTSWAFMVAFGVLPAVLSKPLSSAISVILELCSGLPVSFRIW